MLAQNFKTPADLGISDAEFEALVKVLGMLERGEIKNTPPRARYIVGAPIHVTECERAPTHFSMGYEVAYHDCGTSCCIMGWARWVGDDDRLFRDATSINHSAQPLFYPYNDGILERRVGIGAIALRNYLTHGEPRWEEALEA